jgi:hypothetical protein
MKVTIAESLICLIILLITSQSVSPALLLPDSIDSLQTNFHSSQSKASLASILFEKTEEEQTEEERCKYLTVELADFTRLAVYLSLVHTPNIPFLSLEQHFDTQPPLFKRFCVFII